MAGVRLSQAKERVVEADRDTRCESQACELTSCRICCSCELGSKALAKIRHSDRPYNQSC